MIAFGVIFSIVVCITFGYAIYAAGYNDGYRKAIDEYKEDCK